MRANQVRPTTTTTELREIVMTALAMLWLPILLGAVFVFIASSIIHMGPFWHRGDFPQLPDEPAARAAIGPLKVPPGDYMLPGCKDPSEMRTPEFKQRMTEGPVMILTVRPNGQWAMGKSLTQWFVYLVIVALFAGYVAAIALPPGAHYLSVFRFVGTSAFMALSFGVTHDSIWFSRKWSTTIKLMFDGLIYALLLAGTFGWLWPK
jgi:hypothetical protein